MSATDLTAELVRDKVEEVTMMRWLIPTGTASGNVNMIALVIGDRIKKKYITFFIHNQEIVTCTVYQKKKRPAN